MREMTHCCCCVPLPDGVMLVGVYGTAFHTGLLVIQVIFYHNSFEQYLKVFLKMINNSPFLFLRTCFEQFNEKY